MVYSKTLGYYKLLVMHNVSSPIADDLECILVLSTHSMLVDTKGLMLQAQSDIAVEHAMTLYRDVVRRLLKVTQGYECQEADGNFMLAFHQPVKALQFCLLVCTLPHMALHCLRVCSAYWYALCLTSLCTACRCAVLTGMRSALPASPALHCAYLAKQALQS